MGYKTPVLLCNFNRPEFTAKVVRSLRSVKPEALFISIDGPRADVESDRKNCNSVLEVLQKGIDWPCQIKWSVNDSNKGCGKCVSEAISWFFNQVEEGIILEDDTLPGRSFFQFAECMLERYRNDARVMHISGNNFQFGRIRGDGSYYASRFAHSWGWATWRRAWNLYENKLSGFPEQWTNIAEKCNLAVDIREWWSKILENTNDGFVNTWDFQWHYAVMKNQGVCLIPNRNLVVNIGVGNAATHMKSVDVASSITISQLTFFNPPSSLSINGEADRFDFDYAVTNHAVPKMNAQEAISSLKFQLLQNVYRIGKIVLKKN